MSRGEMVGGLFLDIHERAPRTWGGNAWWVTGQAQISGLDQTWVEDYVHFAYIKYIQGIEDFDKAVECPRFGKEIRDSQLSDTPQGVTLWGSRDLSPT